mmetsp:Transcript_10211/g.35264  ORF Transcript_10211/g.35264 Transcript_10211/m.35264 type:complete len:88 (-) Transcript_10211:296-559(-)
MCHYQSFSNSSAASDREVQSLDHRTTIQIRIALSELPILLVAVRSRSIFMRSPVTSRHIIRICEHCVLLLAFVSLDSFHLLISIQAE